MNDHFNVLLHQARYRFLHLPLLLVLSTILSGHTAFCTTTCHNSTNNNNSIAPFLAPCPISDSMRGALLPLPAARSPANSTSASVWIRAMAIARSTRTYRGFMVFRASPDELTGIIGLPRRLTRDPRFPSNLGWIIGHVRGRPTDYRTVRIFLVGSSLSSWDRLETWGVDMSGLEVSSDHLSKTIVTLLLVPVLRSIGLGPILVRIYN